MLTEPRDDLRARMIRAIELSGYQAWHAYDVGNPEALVVPASGENLYREYPLVLTAVAAPGSCVFAAHGRYIEVYG